MIRFVLTLFWWLAAFFRSHHDPGLELVALRQQVGALQRKNPRQRLGLFQPRLPAPEFLEAASSFIERGVGLAEGKPHLLAARGGIAVETAARDDRDTDFPDEIPGKLYIIRKAEGGDIRHDIVGAPRYKTMEADLLECCE